MEEHNLEVPQKVDKREQEERHYQKIATEIPPDEKKDVNKNQVSKTESTTTTWNKTLIWFDSWDKRLSHFFFVVKLPFLLECLLSVPGNFFGVPVFTTVVAPSLVAWMVAVSTESQTPPLWWRGLVLLAFLVVLMIWVLMLVPTTRFSQAKFLFFGARAALVSPPVGVALLHFMGDGFETSQQVGFFALAAWCVAVLPVALLKPLCQRQRPILSFCENKHLSQIRIWLIKDGLRSFPSGDVAGAVAFAYPLIRCQVIPRELALLFPLLSCIGRLYWMAHHLTDVVAGVVVSYTFLYLLEMVLVVTQDDNINSCPCRAEWWHALLAQLLLIITVATMRIILRVKVFGSGVMQATNDDGRKSQAKNKSL